MLREAIIDARLAWARDGGQASGALLRLGVDSEKVENPILMWLFPGGWKPESSAIPTIPNIFRFLQQVTTCFYIQSKFHQKSLTA